MAYRGSGSAGGPRRDAPKRRSVKRRVDRAVARSRPGVKAPPKPKVGRPVARKPAAKRRPQDKTYRRPEGKPGFDRFAKKKKHEDGSERKTLANRRFPYAHPEQVAWANFKADSDRVWMLVRRDFGGKKPRVSQARKGSRAAKDAAGFAPRGGNDVYITSEAYMGDKDKARKTLLHEIAHTRQRAGKMSKALVEGEAESKAQHLARKRLGQRNPRSSTPEYRRWAARYGKRKVAGR